MCFEYTEVTLYSKGKDEKTIYFVLHFNKTHLNYLLLCIQNVSRFLLKLFLNATISKTLQNYMQCTKKVKVFFS